MSNFESIPAELKDRDQWLLWSYDSTPSKRPLNEHGYGASWSDPKDWLSYERACELAASSDNFDGVGFVISKSDPYTGLDLDGCLREANEAKVKKWLPSLRDFNNETYMEYSVSGTGIHVFSKDVEVPDWWSDSHFSAEEHEGVEAYDEKFFVMTGNEIETSVSEISDVDPSDFLLSAFETINGGLPKQMQKNSEESSSRAHASNNGSGNTDDIIEAIENLTPSDLPLQSSFTDDENSSVESWDPGYRTSESGKSLKMFTSSGKFVDMMEKEQPFSVLELFAAERGIITAPYVGLSGDDWKEAVDEARDAGAPIPEYEASSEPQMPTADLQDGDGPSDEHWAQVREMYAQKETETKYPRKAAADLIISKKNFATPRDTEELWEYFEQDGVYERGGQATVDSILARQLGPHYSQRERREIIGNIKARTYIDREDFDGGDGFKLICVANGVLDLKTRELKDHSPEYFFTRAVPVEYDPDADAGEIESFLTEITRRNEDKLTMEEMVGATLWPTYLKGKFLILFGEGANGKTTFFNVLTQFLGKHNISGWDLQDLGENRFASSALVGKYANIGGDMDSVKIQNTGTLKTLTGGDPTMVEEKGKPAFEFENSATLIFGANRPPVIDEASRAVKRRLVPIRLPHEFTDAKDDGNPDATDPDDLLDALTSEEQLSGLLNLALDGLDRLRNNGDVSLPENQDERLEYYEQFSDPIKEFAVNCLTNESDAQVRKSDVYEAYKQFSIKEDYTVKSANVFWRQLRQTTFHYDESRRRTEDGRKTFLQNARFTSHGRSYAPSYTVEEMGDGEESDEEEHSKALDKPEPGFATMEVRVAEKLDAPDWMAGKGHLVDDAGNIAPYEAEGSNPLEDISEGDRVHLKNAKVENRKGIPTLVLSGITDAKSLSKPGKQSGLKKQSAAATDGGADSLEEKDDETEEETEEPPTNVRDKAQSMAEFIGAREVGKHELWTAWGSEHDLGADAVDEVISKAREQGYVEKLGGQDVYRSLL